MGNKEFIIENGKLVSYVGETDINELVIPAGVQIICGRFLDNQPTNKIKIVIPKNVTIIESYAFSGCDVSEIEFQNDSQLREVGACFASGSIKKLVIPQSVKNIHISAFAELKCEEIELDQQFSNKNIKFNENAKISYVCNDLKNKSDNSISKQKKKIKNEKSQYKHWDQYDLISKYVRNDELAAMFPINSILVMIIAAIFFAGLALGLGWIFTLLGSLMEEYPNLWYWFPGVAAGLTFVGGIIGIDIQKDQEQLAMFIEDKAELNRRLQASRFARAAAAKQAKTNSYSSYSSSSSSNNSSESSSSSSSSYDTYNSSGVKTGSVENKGSGRINNVYDNNGNVIGWANDNGGDMMDVHYNDGSTGTINKN